MIVKPPVTLVIALNRWPLATSTASTARPTAGAVLSAPRTVPEIVPRAPGTSPPPTTGATVRQETSADTANNATAVVNARMATPPRVDECNLRAKGVQGDEEPGMCPALQSPLDSLVHVGPARAQARVGHQGH